MELTALIETRPGVRSGKPCCVGTRIAVDDVLRFLVAGIEQLPPGGYDAGGTEALPYVDLVSRYLRVAGQHRLKIPVPVPVPLGLASWVASRLTPVAEDMVADLVLSLSNTMVCDEDRVGELVPGERTTIDDALRRARVELAESTAAAPMAGLVSAFVFAVQMLNFPVGIGTSGHLMGGALAAVL